MSAPEIVLEQFERAVYAQRWEQAGARAVQMLRALRAGGTFAGYPITEATDRVLYTRAAAAVVAMLAAPGFTLTHDGFAALAAEHATLDALLRVSGLGSADHLLALVSDGKATGAEMKFGDGGGLVKALAAHSLRSGFKLKLRETFARMPAVFLPLWAGMLATMQAAAPDAHARREELAGCHDLFAGLVPPPAALAPLAEAYMFLSYCERPDKHAAKATIHGMYAQALRAAKAPIQDPATLALRGANRQRPVLLVCLEWWTSVHAMFRCYAPALRELRTTYKLVGAGRARDTDPQARAEFDDWLMLDEQPNLIGVIKKINSIAPDAILYPSLGMSLWWTALASVRLAPVQMMMLGHPAASHSPCIDAIVCEEGSFGPGFGAACPPPERIVTYRRGASRFVRRPDHEHVAATPSADGIVRVAIPAMLAKVSAPFLAMLARVKDRAVVPVEWHLFPNQTGLGHRLAEQELREALTGAVAHPRQGFGAYLAALARCDLAVMPFPFGGTNSTIDCLSLGVPVLTLEGEEPHARFDAMMLRRIDYPDDWIAESPGDLEDAAVAAIAHEHHRERLRAAIARADLDAAFFGPDPGLPGRAITEAVQAAIAGE